MAASVYALPTIIIHFCSRQGQKSPINHPQPRFLEASNSDEFISGQLPATPPARRHRTEHRSETARRSSLVPKYASARKKRTVPLRLAFCRIEEAEQRSDKQQFAPQLGNFHWQDAKQRNWNCRWVCLSACGAVSCQPIRSKYSYFFCIFNAGIG